jgi:hypothetical protein
MVSASDVERIRQFVAAFDLERQRSGGLKDYFDRWYSPDATMEHVDAFPTPGGWTGFDAYQEWFEEAYGPYEDVRYELDSIETVGERVLALATVSGRVKGDTVELQLQVGLAYRIRDGRIEHTRVYAGHDRAREGEAEAIARGES